MAGTWGKAKVNHADLIQNKAYRYFLGVHNFTPVAAMQAEMGWLPAKFRRLLNMIRFWNRMMKMPNDRLTKQMFNTDYLLANANDNWSKSVRDIFITFGKVDIYENKSECDITFSEQKLFELFENECKSSILSKPKLRTYKTFKNDCNTTDYVKSCMNRYERSLLAKFRCGILQLKIETGRFNQTKLEDRLCDICN